MANEYEIPEQRFEEVERFLLNRMSEEEAAQFTEKMNSDPLLQRQIADLRLIVIGIEESGLRDQFNEFHKGIANGPVQKTVPVFRRWLIAASILIIFSAAAWLFLRPSKSERLFDSYFRPDAGLVTRMGPSDNYAFGRAMVDYKTGNYRKAIEAWHNLLAASSGNDTLNYFLGSAELASKNPGAAIEYFNKVLQDTGSNFRNDANWYLGLSLLLENKTGESIPYLERSTNPEKENLLLKLKE